MAKVADDRPPSLSDSVVCFIGDDELESVARHTFEPAVLQALDGRNYDPLSVTPFITKYRILSFSVVRSEISMIGPSMNPSSRHPYPLIVR